MNLEISQIVILVVVGCLFLWRISYGTNNGLFAEAAGLIAVIASYFAVYYLMSITGSVLGNRFGEVIPKIGYLVVAFAVYSLMTALANALRKVKEIPILGGLDRLLGAVLGGIEAALIIYIVEYVTGFKILQPAIAACSLLFSYIQKTFINN
ncbi:CvpA family protein [Butyrivibrio sp. XPD2006]|uniref:CvpA family protein n=1 Tax=Butyrivibrio sp. XPD2006 TaxID=1280668 RepID=UPI0003B650AA|nr:CvpA family protein [Butyrivibrio sp. XPD2006]